MAYNGYLLKIGNYTFPQSKIKADTYKAYVNMQDLEPYTDADGYLHREAVDLKALKVEFDTVPMLDNTEFAEIMKNIDNNITNEAEQRVTITAYIPRYDKYVTQTGYMADIQPQIYGTYNNKITYDSIRFAFIGGVADD